MYRKKVRVLIVDDSMMFCEVLRRGLQADESVEVVGTASDPYMARDKIIELQPDVMTLDIEMPKMNGIEFLKKLMPQYPIPVVVISGVSRNVFEALNAGAVDFVGKPDVTNNREIGQFINEVIIKVKIASTAKVGHWKSSTGNDRKIIGNSSVDSSKIIAIGASTGGTEATFKVLSMLPRAIPGIVIVQHMPPVFTKMYAERLNNTCMMEVKEAQSGDLVLPGRALLAPGDSHMKLVKSSGGYHVECYKGERVNGHCPSVDVLFESVAEAAGSNALGVILTGMGYDGAKGLLKMRMIGARTIGQDEATCVVYGMPKVAYEIGAVEKQAPLENIAQMIFEYR